MSAAKRSRRYEQPPLILADEALLRLAGPGDKPSPWSARTLQERLERDLAAGVLAEPRPDPPSRSARIGLLIALGGSALGWAALIGAARALAHYFG